MVRVSLALSPKDGLFIAIKSAEGIDELKGLIAGLHFTVFHRDQVVLHRLPTLLLKGV